MSNTATVPAQLRPIVDAVLESLEKGAAPWIKPWASSPELIPVNGVRKTPYRGINRIYLSLMVDKMGWETGHFATYQAWKTLGGHVRKGEKGTNIVYYGRFDADKKDDNGQVIVKADGTNETRSIPILRGYTVFNRAQCDNLPELPAPDPATVLSLEERLSDSEEVLADAGSRINVTMNHNGNHASYLPGSHTINLPKAEKFMSGSAYVQTWSHELIHATGHESLLNRPGITEFNGFGSENYAKEELVAELGAALTLQYLQVDDPRCGDQAVAYLSNWLKALTKDPGIFPKACAEAQKAFFALFPEDKSEEA
jgi:antirestriction protein ArdC